MTLGEPRPGETLGFDIDDGSGLRVARARFESESKFAWSLFDGFDRIRILTYSAGVSAIVRLLDRHGFSDFECVFGCENTLRTLRDIMAFQQVAIGDTRAAIKNLSHERHAFILSRVRDGQARFRVLRKQIAHAKLYLLENTESGRKRAFIGSANLSETAFGGLQSETLVCFDDDAAAWSHYLGMYEAIRDQASDEVPLPSERVEHAEISLLDVPVLDPNDHSTLVIDSTEAEQQEGNVIQINVPTQIERIERMKAAIPPAVANLIPPPRNGRQQITRELRREIAKEFSRIRVVQTEEEADHRELSIDRDAKTVSLFGEPFSLEPDPIAARSDAKLLVEFFGNYEGTFEGGMGVERLQRDYFILWSWLYFSPFMCDMRTLAGHDGDIVQIPVFRHSLRQALMRQVQPHRHVDDLDVRQGMQRRQERVHQGQAPGYPVRLQAVPRRVRRHRQARHTQPRGGRNQGRGAPTGCRIPLFRAVDEPGAQGFHRPDRQAQSDDLHHHGASFLQGEPAARLAHEDTGGAPGPVHQPLPGIPEEGAGPTG